MRDLEKELIRQGEGQTEPLTGSVEERAKKAFPAPAFRAHQRKAIVETVRAFEDEGKDVVVLDAPTGFGKSITLWTVPRAMNARAYYLTPLKSLQDQLVEDDFIGDSIVDIKGRSNYSCALPDENVTVDKGKCVREDDFDCHVKDECPYYVRKDEALRSDMTTMNLAYAMAESNVPDGAEGKFGPRELVIVDECQSMEDWGISQVSVTVSNRTVPNRVWERVDVPRADGMEDMDDWLEWMVDEVIPVVQEELAVVSNKAIRTESETKDMERLQQFSSRVESFMADVQKNHWVWQVEQSVRKNRANTRKVTFKPIRIGRFLDDLVWDRGEHIILSSATIPKGNFLSEVGLADRDVKWLSIPSSFPVENRPVVTKHAVGKMTYDERESTAPEMAKKIKEIADFHDGEKGLIHCRGYNIAEMLTRWYRNNGCAAWFDENVAVQDRDAREESLESWQRGDTQVFFSVNMAEGIDLEGDACRWQVLAKTLYPHLGDERVSYRVNELNDWTWYNGKAVNQVEQAYGRAVRSEDDEAVFYILDESAIGLLDRSPELHHDWFKAAVTDYVVG